MPDKETKSQKPQSVPSKPFYPKKKKGRYIRERVIFGDPVELISDTEMSEWIDQRLLVLIDSLGIKDKQFTAESTIVRSEAGYEAEIILEETPLSLEKKTQEKETSTEEQKDPMAGLEALLI